MIALFNTLIFEPLFNLLVFVVSLVPGNELGVAIIIVTLIIRGMLYPLSHKALKSQRQLTKLQPEIKKIQEKHKKDKQEQSKAIMEFYKENNINPFSGCVPFLIQIPIIIGLYRVFLININNDIGEHLYSFVSAPENINTVFLNIDLVGSSVFLAVLAGGAQFGLSKLTFSRKSKSGAPAASGKAADFQNMMGKQMTYVLPVVTVFIAQNFPAGLVLYWFITTLFSFGQQYVINKSVD
ncbi:MAG: YidC/Oxa1 family membrane protein insertase [Candidatus Spechtbacterales bacterium]